MCARNNVAEPALGDTPGPRDSESGSGRAFDVAVSAAQRSVQIPLAWSHPSRELWMHILADRDRLARQRGPLLWVAVRRTQCHTG